MIPILGGEGPATPASFSRFVLPFAYLPTYRGGATERGWRYVPCRTDDRDTVARRRYLTVETAEVLFRRARWLELVGPTGEEHFYEPFEVHRQRWGTGSFQARLRPPRLALFEWSQQCKLENHGQHGDLLASGFLILDVHFPATQGGINLEDLLAFNELFRYWQEPFENHDKEKGCSVILGEVPIKPDAPVPRFAATSLQEKYFGRWAGLLQFPIEVDGRRWRLLPPAWETEARKWVLGHAATSRPGWAIYADSRTYVWTAAVLHAGLGAVRRATQDAPEAERGTASGECSDREEPAAVVPGPAHGHWIKLLNVDFPKGGLAATHQSTAFERRWAEERTYKRWEEGGTLYGFGYHSGAMLGAPVTGFNIVAHWAGIYFDQTLLLLYLRVTLFRFSSQLSKISAESRRDSGRGRNDEWLRRFQDLRHSFTLFTNLYEFPLLSNQQQGIEMYEIARQQMDIKALFQEVRGEIHSTHEYFQGEAAQRLNKVVVLLAVVAAVTGFFGMNLLVEDYLDPAKWGRVEDRLLLTVLLLVASFVIVYRVFKWRSVKSGRGRVEELRESWLESERRKDP